MSQDIKRDPVYGNINTRSTDEERITLPLTTGGVAHVCILQDESDMQVLLDQQFPGNLMNGTPSIELAVPFGFSGESYATHLTWQEAYNLGRALIDIANVAYYS